MAKTILYNHNTKQLVTVNEPIECTVYLRKGFQIAGVIHTGFEELLTVTKKQKESPKGGGPFSDTTTL